MYNPELKELFLKEYTDSEGSAERYRRVFERLGEFESKYGDLSSFSDEQMTESLTGAIGLRSKTRRDTVSFINSYCAWCAKNNISGATRTFEYNAGEDMSVYRNKMVSTPEDMQEFLDAIFQPETDCTVDNIYRCYYWLAYMGVKEDDVLELKLSNVDDRDRVVRFKDDSFHIYREASSAFIFAKTLKEFRYIHPRYTKDCWKSRFPGDTLIRGIKEPNEVCVRSTVSIANKKAFNNGKTQRRISYSSARLSGMFFRIYEREKEYSVSPDFTSLISDRMKDTEYKLDSGRNTIDAIKRRLEKEYRSDYEYWKKAFSL